MRWTAAALPVACFAAACGSGDGTGGSAKASASAPSDYGEVTFQHIGVRIMAPPEIRSVDEIANAADTSGKTYLSTVHLGTSLDPIDLLFLNDSIVVPASLDAIQKDSRNKQIEKLPTGGVAYFRGDEPTVWLPLKGKPNVTCSLATKKTEEATALAWKICRSLRPLDG